MRDPGRTHHADPPAEVLTRQSEERLALAGARRAARPSYAGRRSRRSFVARLLQKPPGQDGRVTRNRSARYNRRNSWTAGSIENRSLAALVPRDIRLRGREKSSLTACAA